MNIKSIAPLLFLLVLGGAAYYFTQSDHKNKNNPNEDWVMKVEDKDDMNVVLS